jgi:hypothetical protein
MHVSQLHVTQLHAVDRRQARTDARTLTAPAACSRQAPSAHRRAHTHGALSGMGGAGPGRLACGVGLTLLELLTWFGLPRA